MELVRARVQCRHMELNGPEKGKGSQITLFDDGASLTVPYWHKGQKAQAVFSEIWNYLKVLQEVGGYQIYDPQAERIIDLAADLDPAIKCYAKVVNAIW